VTRVAIAGLPFASQWRKRNRVRARSLQSTGSTCCVHARVCAITFTRMLVALGTAGILALLPTCVQAAPWLRVRAQVSIELHAQRASQGMRLIGTLRDDLGTPLKDREVMGYFEVQSRQSPSARMRGVRARTDEHGQFAMPVPCPSHQACRATIEFDGDTFHERSAATAWVEPERAEVLLAFEEPQALALSLDEPQVQVSVNAQSAASGANLQIVLENELARRVASGVTDASGQLSLQIDSHLFGEPGLGELILRSAADTTRSAARIRKPILRTRQSQLALHAQYERKQQTLNIRIQLRTREGPLSQRAVGIFAGSTHIITLVTDAEGSAERTLLLTPLADSSNGENGPLSLGRHALSARFDSDVPGLGSARSAPVLVQVEPPPRPNSAWLIVPAAASIAFAVWSARRSQRKQTPQVSAWLRGSEVQLGGLAAWTAANHHTLTGVVEDADDAHPLPATISLSSGVGFTASLKVSSHSQGRFDSGPLPTGRFRARVFAPGYEPAEFELSIPHSGTGTQMRIALRSLRVIALDTYDSVLSPMVGPESARRRTVRETLTAAVSGGLARENVGPLADSVEHMAYGRAVPLESDLRDLQRRAATTLEEIARRIPDSQNPGSDHSQT